MLVGWRSVRWRKCQRGWTRERHERERQEACSRRVNEKSNATQQSVRTDGYGGEPVCVAVRYTVVGGAVEQRPILTLV